MICLISPSKDLNYKDSYPGSSKAIPRLWEKSWPIVEVLKKKKSRDLQKLMDISVKLADENVSRNQAFNQVFDQSNSRPALFAFSGDVYRGIDAYHMKSNELDYCQDHVRILSGLYGLLKPFDLMQAYRLEMGTSLPVKRKPNLYKYWGSQITDLLNDDITSSGAKCVINLASHEYFHAIQPKHVVAPIVNIHFRELRAGKLIFVSYTAKVARGLMIKHLAQMKASTIKHVKSFNLDHYSYDESKSTDTDLFFIR